ncbi:MAG: glutamate racemase [Candidatus Sumerlaeota bacterium]|nr:glutamate racemase [Candidatus Sumerlaeota bacterium]
MFFLDSCHASAETDAALAGLLESDSLRLVVTDSGFGGLSVAADTARRAEESRAYRRVELIFVNALFRDRGGYNSLAAREDKIRIFNAALAAMAGHEAPDALLVACNTLSVLLPDCAFARGSSVPIAGMVEPGVDLIARVLEDNPGAAAILFATQTTVAEGSHHRGLLERGIAGERFVVQSCPDLAGQIEDDPLGPETERMIASFVSDAASKLAPSDGPVFASLNCTHFGYSAEVWERRMRASGVPAGGLLNPNDRMAAPLFPAHLHGRFAQTDVTVRTVSMVDIPATAVNALAPVLARTSPATARAMENWEKVPGLFEWEIAAT